MTSKHRESPDPLPPSQGVESAPQILPDRDELAKWIKKDYEYLNNLRRLTNIARKRIGLNIEAFADRFHSGNITAAARELGVNKATAAEWVAFARLYRSVPDNELPETRDDARKGRNARAYRKTGKYSTKPNKGAPPSSPRAATPQQEATAGDAHGVQVATILPQKRAKKKGGYATTITLDEAGRPLVEAAAPLSAKSQQPTIEADEEQPLTPEQETEEEWALFKKAAIRLIGAERLHEFLQAKLTELKQA